MIRPLSICLLIASGLICSSAVAADEPIMAVKGVQPKATVFEAAKRDAPAVLRGADEAAKYFDDEALAALKKQVDFEKQVVLVFAWRGSGQDRLTYAVAESFPEQIFFTVKPGRTRDLREHVQVYALRANVKWSVR